MRASSVSGEIMYFMKAKNIKILFLVVAVIFGLLYAVSYNKESKINSIENYERIFYNVEELQFFAEENNFYSTTNPTKDLKELKKVKLNYLPVSEDRSKNREFEYKIIINGKFSIYINSDFSQLWLDDSKTININYNDGSWSKELNEGILPSFSYFIENPEVLKNLFQEHSQHLMR